MSIYNIDINELRLLLKFKGIILDEYNDDELKILIQSKIRELEGFIGADIHPHDRVEVRQNFTNSSFPLSYYPLLNIHRVYLNDHIVCRDDYNVNYKTGMVYFNKNVLARPVHYYPRRFGKGYNKTQGDVLKIEYTTGVDEEFFINQILPLITDMVAYTISYGKANNRLGGLAGFVNSLHEGDLSMNFGSNNGGNNSNYGYGIGVNNRIDELSRLFKYNSRVSII